MPKKDNQKKFLEAYEKAFGNVTQACKAVGISRGTFYAWQTDAAFQKQLAEIEPEEMFVDFAEHALAKKIQGGDTTAIIFALKTKGKRRGYVERSEHELSGRDGDPIQIVKVVRPVNNDEQSDNSTD